MAYLLSKDRAGEIRIQEEKGDRKGKKEALRRKAQSHVRGCRQKEAEKLLHPLDQQVSGRKAAVKAGAGGALQAALTAAFRSDKGSPSG